MAAEAPHGVESGEHKCRGCEPFEVGREVGAEVFDDGEEGEFCFHQAREGAEELEEDID